MKHWRRAGKVRLILDQNPDWGHYTMRAAAHRRSPDGMASEHASGQFVDQSRRGHSVTDDDQRLAHGISLLGA